MQIIFFTGAGITPSMVDKKFISELEKIYRIIIPDLKYKYVYYEKDVKLNIDDIDIIKTIKKIKFNKKEQYIVIGHSDGIYFAMEFSRQNPKNIKEIISLDGSWITIKMCNQRLENWKNKNKIVKLITNKEELNDISLQPDMAKKIMDHKRYEHTLRCIKNKYENIIKNINFTCFRDFNGVINSPIDEQFNTYALLEDGILEKKSSKYKIFWLVNAGHNVWSRKKYRNQIINYINQL